MTPFGFTLVVVLVISGWIMIASPKFQSQKGIGLIALAILLIGLAEYLNSIPP